MSLSVIRDDITRLHVDAIVDPTDGRYSGSGGADGSIHRAAGRRLRWDLARRKGLAVGEAVITNGYKLPSKYLILTRGPIWDGGEDGEAEQLARCYENCLALAKENGCRSIAFPLISGGTFGFPNDDALRIAKDTITDFLRHDNMEVYIVTYMRHTFNLGAKLFADVSSYVDDNYIEISTATDLAFYDREESFPSSFEYDSYSLEPRGEERETVCYSVNPNEDFAAAEDEQSYSREEMLRLKSETFSCMLARLVDESGRKPPEVYNAARVTRSVYSKIMGNIHYKPSKLTAVAFGLALKLPWKELKTLVESAGYSLTHTNKFDIVIEYFVREGNYNLDDINGVLYDLDPDLPLIGC